MTREMFFVALGLGVPLVGWIAAEWFILRHIRPYGKDEPGGKHPGVHGGVH